MPKPVAVLHCHFCGKSVSTGFRAVPTDTPDRGIIIRALIICPECIEKELIFKKDSNPEDMEMVEDKCRHCGAHVGWGIKALHIGVCDDCSERRGY